mgnify:CR=1 FL=1
MESPNDAIRERARFLARHSEGYEVHNITLLMLYDMEVPLNYSGFQYLKNAVLIAYRSPSQISLKEVFQEVGKLYFPEVGYDTIDSGIRDAIKKAWNSRYNDRWNYYFPEHILLEKNPPCNSDIISGMVYFLEMWHDSCRKEVKYAG